MSKTMTFEALLDDAFERYLADAPVEVDVAAVAAHLVSIDRNRRVGHLGASARRRHVAIAFAVGLLVLAFAATALFLIGRLQQRPLVDRGPGWHVVEQMHSARTGDGGVALLSDGRVMIVGNTYREVTDAADVFDPRTGRWSLTSPLPEPRAGFYKGGRTTVLSLRDGRVLVFGGEETPSRSTELYDPQSDSWATAGSMPTDSFWSPTTLLNDGTVLGIGESVGSLPNRSVIFDPSTGTWANTGSLTEGRSSPTATLLLDGRVLVAGGSSTGASPEATHNLASAELYDPRSRSWTVTASMLHPRLGHIATRLSDGRVLVAGGYDDNTSAHSFATAEIYDANLGTWSATGSMNVPRGGAAATLLPDGRVLVTGGVSEGIDGPIHASAEVFDPLVGTWTYTFPMALARFRHAAVLMPDGTVMVVGGKDTATDDALSSAEVYVPGASITP